MTPADILNRPMPKSPTCVDCLSPATIVDRPMPLCDLHAKVLLCPDVKLELCLACLMSYDRDAFDRCPNMDCPYANASRVCRECGNTDWLVQGVNNDDPLCESCYAEANDPENYDFDGPEPEDEWPAD